MVALGILALVLPLLVSSPGDARAQELAEPPGGHAQASTSSWVEDLQIPVKDMGSEEGTVTSLRRLVSGRRGVLYLDRAR